MSALSDVARQATRLRAVPDRRADEGDGDPFSTLIPDGQYRVAFVSEESGQVFDRRVWFIRLAITEPGEHHGKPLLRFYNMPPGKRRLARSSNLWRDYLQLTCRRPPSRGCRPSELLAGCEVLAEVVTVTERAISKQEREELKRQGAKKIPPRVPIPPAARYSKVDRLLAITAGTPRCLRRRRTRR